MKDWAEREAALATLVESVQKFISAADAYEAALGGLARVEAEGDMVRAEADLRRALHRLRHGREI